MSTMSENVSPLVLKRVAKELKSLSKSSPEGINVHINEEDLTDIQATITGPESTPYEGGVFRIKLTLSADFPQSPPKGYFVTKIFHPNVSADGSICVNTLKRDWKPENTLSHVLTVIKCLLIHPNPASALNEDAGKLLLENFDEFAKHARMMTDIHAKHSKQKSSSSSSTEKGAEKKKAKAEKKKKKKNLKRL
eukprot:m.35455 g.35455  ORF g.35455 m.35455 type:complete len:193 (+) comp10019_c0_seq1:217-795(+)